MSRGKAALHSQQACALAAELIDSGKAEKKLEEFIEQSNR